MCPTQSFKNVPNDYRIRSKATPRAEDEQRAPPRANKLTSHLRTSPMATSKTPQVEHKPAKTPLSEQGDVKEEGSVLRYATDD